MICKECGAEFDSAQNLHKHLKAHNLLVSQYYQKHFPKFDRLTGEKILFKDTVQYEADQFVSARNMRAWLDSAENSERREFIAAAISRRLNDKKIDFGPPNLYLKLCELPETDYIRESFGSCRDFYSSINRRQVFTEKLPKDFRGNMPKMEIITDTREQKPYNYGAKNVLHKLEVGDYTAGGEFYSATFVDRKSESDFKGTFTAGYERFRRELDRARRCNSFLFVVAETNPGLIELGNKYGNYGRVNLNLLWHNVKEIIADYSDCCQFVFAGSRENGKDLTYRILFFGKQLWNCDLDYFLEKEIKHVG